MKNSLPKIMRDSTSVPFTQKFPVRRQNNTILMMYKSGLVGDHLNQSVQVQVSVKKCSFCENPTTKMEKAPASHEATTSSGPATTAAINDMEQQSSAPHNSAAVAAAAEQQPSTSREVAIRNNIRAIIMESEDGESDDEGKYHRP